MSIKKSIFLLIAVIAVVTAAAIVSSGGDSMQIDMGDTAITFSGIDDFRHEIAYGDIAALSLEDVSDWSVWGGQEFGHFRIGHLEGYVLFATTQADKVIVATLDDGSRMVFNYNTASSTEAIYEMLLQNIQ